MLCNIKQSKAEAKVNIIHSVMKVKLRFCFRGGVCLPPFFWSLKGGKKMLTRVNKKDSGACICIVLNITKENQLAQLFFLKSKHGNAG